MTVAKDLVTSDLVTSDHQIEWFINYDTVQAVITCTAPAGAPCRLVCPEGCEELPCDHEPVDGGECYAVLWLNEQDPAIEEAYDGQDRRPLVNGPIIPKWNGDGYDWVYA